MEVQLNNGHRAWIYYPEQCSLCKGFIFSNGKPCEKEKTKEFINSLLQLEHHTKGVYGSLDFKCDYFNLDEEAYKASRYCEASCPG